MASISDTRRNFTLDDGNLVVELFAPATSSSSSSLFSIDFTPMLTGSTYSLDVRNTIFNGAETGTRRPSYPTAYNQDVAQHPTETPCHPHPTSRLFQALCQSSLERCPHFQDVHARYRTASHDSVVACFNERFILSLVSCDDCLFLDDN
ncbi:hypothetical protein C8F01DRAFT_91872 [Mycena amicta]|nr:hypothetical protein C8F01DRAFT_91872 [Mycena amicta]